MQQDTPVADRLRRQQAALASFGLEAFRSRDLDHLLNRAAELVSQGLDARMVKVLELLPGGAEFRIRGGVGWQPGVVGVETFGADSDSPAGYALKQNEPVCSPDVARETRFGIPQVLRDHDVKSMVNVIIEGDEGPFGVLEVDAPQPREFHEDDVAFLKNYANLLAAAIDRHRAHVRLERAQSEQKVLVQELAHRVKNMLGLVQSLASQMTAQDASARDFQDMFLGRLRALARAENLVFEDHAREVDLHELVDRATEPFRENVANAVRIEGPPVRAQARSGRILALVLHELLTNAVKHGALSTPRGRVLISWSTSGDEGDLRLRLEWREEDGPPAAPPEREGFGSRLLRRMAGYELDGTASLDYRPDGLRYTLEFPLRSE